MKIVIGKSSAPDNRMPGDESDSRIVRITRDLNPLECVPRISEQSDGSLLIDCECVCQETASRIQAVLGLDIWGDVRIQTIQ